MAKYNLRERKEKPAVYRTAIKPEVIDAIYEQILKKMIVEKKYRDPEYTAQKLAEEINTNTRYISATVSLRFQMNFASLIAGYRVRDAIAFMTDKRNRKYSMEYVAQNSGFANRQSFYAAFYRVWGKSPRQYQDEFFANLEQAKQKKKQ